MSPIQKPRVSVFIATSLDGFIARQDGDVAWLHEGEPPPEGEDLGFGELMNAIDYLLMGRVTFEKVLEFGQWPYEKPVMVLSRSLTEVPGHLQSRVSITSDSPEALMKRLDQAGVRHVYLDGGKVIQSFLGHGLVDDLCLTTLPILLGQGRPLFGALTADIHLKHRFTKAWDNGFVQSSYRVLHASKNQALQTDGQ